MTEESSVPEPVTAAGRRLVGAWHLLYGGEREDEMRREVLAIEAEARDSAVADAANEAIRQHREAHASQPALDVNWWERALSDRNGSNRAMAEFVVQTLRASQPALPGELDVDMLRDAALDVESGYINRPDRQTRTYWSKIAARYAYLARLVAAESE